MKDSDEGDVKVVVKMMVKLVVKVVLKVVISGEMIDFMLLRGFGDGLTDY